MTDPMELVGLVEGRIGQDFDGECHLTADEARQIAACIREMVEWRPIETAPMDGTEVVAWDGSDNIICHWHDSVAGWVTDWETVSGYDVGWNKVSPTHWLPLPPAPGADHISATLKVEQGGG